jgi:hypothetical protein
MEKKEKTPGANEGLQNGKCEMADNQGKYTIFPPNLKALALAKRAKLKERCPSIPERSLPKIKPLKDNTANALTKAIKLAFELAGGQCERVSNTGRVIDRRKKVTNVLGQRKTIGRVEWVPGTGTNGTADLSAIYQGKSIKIEVKIGKDRQSPEQKAYAQSVEAAGGIYILAKSYQSFVEEIERRLGDGR